MLGKAKKVRHRQGRAPRSSTAPARRRTSRAAAPRSGPRSRRRPPTTTRRSCRSGWRSSPGGVAIIRVGGATEIEVKERKDRVDDAMHATRAAVEEGIVAGGGVALLYATKSLAKLKSAEQRPEGRHRHRAPCAPVRRSARSPRTPAQTARSSSASSWSRATSNYGFDAQKRRVHRHGEGRHHRPDQGRAPAPCRMRRRSPASSSPPRRWSPRSRRRRPAPAAAWRHGRRHGRHGRYGLLSPFDQLAYEAEKGRAPGRGPFLCRRELGSLRCASLPHACPVQVGEPRLSPYARACPGIDA